jgi:hypothetical protein
MKNSIIWAGLALIMLVLCACRSTKLSNRQKAELALSTQSEVNSEQQIDKTYLRRSVLLDSSAQYHQLVIFPLDTFQFSWQEGFRGKASKIVIEGRSEK